jgi:hypothetical protein
LIAFLNTSINASASSFLIAFFNMSTHSSFAFQSYHSFSVEYHYESYRFTSQSFVFSFSSQSQSQSQLLTFVFSSIIQSSNIDSTLMNTLSAKIVDLKKKMKNSSSIIQSSFINSTFAKTLIVKINDLKNKLKNVSSNQIVKLKKKLLEIENKINVLKNALNECVNRMNNATFNIMTISMNSTFRQNNDTSEFDLNLYINDIIVWLSRDFVWWLIVK